MDDLIKQREQLAIDVYNTETDAFPGSRKWQRYNAALMALSAFDSANPEVINVVRSMGRR